MDESLCAHSMGRSKSPHNSGLIQKRNINIATLCRCCYSARARGGALRSNLDKREGAPGRSLSSTIKSKLSTTSCATCFWASHASTRHIKPWCKVQKPRELWPNTAATRIELAGTNARPAAGSTVVPGRYRLDHSSLSVTARRHSDDAAEEARRQLQVQLTMSIATLRRAKEELREEKQRWASQDWKNDEKTIS